MEGLYIKVDFPEYLEYQKRKDFWKHSNYCAEKACYFIEQDWAFQTEPNKETGILGEALAFVKSKLDPSDVCVANERMAEWRCPLNHAHEALFNQIQDFLEEFGDDNDLPEGWWMEYGEIEDLYYKL